MQDDNELDNELEDAPAFVDEGLERATKKRKKRDAWYGERFQGYMKLEECRKLIPSFKDFYYTKRAMDEACGMEVIVRLFDIEYCEPRGLMFFPSRQNLRKWIDKWDADIKNQLAVGKALDKRPEVIQLARTRDADDKLLAEAPMDQTLEGGLRTLAGELMNDAVTMLREDQANPEIYEDEVLVKRKNYVVNVFGHITKMVQGKAALLLKASEEKRANAGFLMDLLAKAQSGKLTDGDISMLKSAYPEPAPAAATVEGEVITQ